MHKTRFVLSKPSSTEEATKSEARMLLCREEKMESGGNNTVSYRIVSLRRVFFWKFPTSTNLLMVPARDKEDEKKKQERVHPRTCLKSIPGWPQPRRWRCCPQWRLHVGIDTPCLLSVCVHRIDLSEIGCCCFQNSVRMDALPLPRHYPAITRRSSCPP